MLKYMCGLIMIMATLPLSADDYDLTPFLQLTPIEPIVENVFEVPSLAPIVVKEVNVSAVPEVKQEKTTNTAKSSARYRGRPFRNLMKLCR